jgi:hypothetical protein
VMGTGARKADTTSRASSTSIGDFSGLEKDEIHAIPIVTD